MTKPPPIHEPNREAARAFLRRLDPDSDRFVFQTFDDSKTRKNHKLARTLIGTLDEHWPTLVALSQQGAGVFVVINKTDLAGRRIENVVAVLSLFSDCDGLPADEIEKKILLLGLRPHLWRSVESRQMAHLLVHPRCATERIQHDASTLSRAFGE
jgi:hypothetical protein